MLQILFYGCPLFRAKTDRISFCPSIIDPPRQRMERTLSQESIEEAGGIPEPELVPRSARGNEGGGVLEKQNINSQNPDKLMVKTVN